MGNFHRFNDPTYHLFAGESFPAVPGGTGIVGSTTYDRINVVDGGSGADNSAMADGAKGSGVNEYTYFVAFGEPALSLCTNRGFKALAQNTDVLDDLFRAAVPKVTMLPGLGADINSVVIADDVFVGDTGATAFGSVAIFSQLGESLYNGTTRIIPTDIDDGLPGSTVIGSGFYSSPTIRFNVAIPAGVPYSLMYGVRSSTARIIEHERHANWQALLWLQQASVLNRSVFYHGLDERYRRSSVVLDVNPVKDSPGAGARIERDGEAVTVWAPVSYNYAVLPPGGAYPDPILASFLCKPDPAAVATTAHETVYAGNIGFAVLSPMKLSETATDVNELITRGRYFAPFYTGVPMNIVGDFINGSESLTRIPDGAPATLVSGVLTLDAPNYFKTPIDRTAIALDYDVFVLQFADGSTRAYRGVSMDTVESMTVKTLDGYLQSSVTPFPCTVKWIQTTSITSGPLGTVFAVPRSPNGQYDQSVANISFTKAFGPTCENFDSDISDATILNRRTAFGWGGHLLGNQSVRGRLLSDGSIHSTAGLCKHNYSKRVTEYLLYSGDTLNIDVDPTSGSSHIVITFAQELAAPTSINFNFVGVGPAGDEGLIGVEYAIDILAVYPVSSVLVLDFGLNSKQDSSTYVASSNTMWRGSVAPAGDVPGTRLYLNKHAVTILL